MATINISSIVSYYNTGTKTTSGTKSVSGYSSSAAARTAALNAANSAADSVGGGTPASGGSSSTADLKFGSSYGSVSKTIGTPGSAMDPDEGTYEGWCSYRSSRTSTMYLVKLAFTIPSGLTAANITSASISFTATASHTTTTEFHICAPKTTSAQINYLKYSETTIIDTSKYVSFNSPGNTTAKSYSLTFTDVFKQCITNGLGWVTLLLPRSTPESSRTMTISGTPQITYTENYSACGAPTSVSCGTAIQKPGATVSISWSGATAGTNNAIAGYTVYYNAGSAPTTSSSSVNVDASPYPFTIPSGAARGTTYYFKVLTRGSVSGYNSGLSSAQTTTKVNSLPSAPTIVSVSPTRIKSTGSTTVTFTITAGSTNDTGQTASLCYATSATGTKTFFTSPLKSSLSAAATYYFWTYDGLEYSSSYTSLSIIKNTPPTIGSITMSAYNNTTYSPSKDNKSYVKNINGSASGVTGTSLSYLWKLCVWSGTGASSFETVTNISTATSISNIDVTSYGANFNTAYKLALTVTDDLGEFTTAYSPTVYVIPAAPTISAIYNQKASGNKGGNTNNSHFEDGIRLNYNENNTGLTRELLYSTNSNFSSFSTISLSGTSYSDVTLSNLTRGATYYFRVKYTCNTKTITSAVSSGYMRANDITPNISTITPQSGSAIKPYTLSLLNFTFTNSPISWATTNDVATSYGAIYSIKLKYSTRSLIATSSGSNSSGTVTGTVTLSSIPTTDWKTLLGTTDAPNTSYTLTLEITATNGFGATFVGSKTFTANFIEGVYSIGTPELRIKTGSSTYTKIPSSYNNQTTTSRYHIFETLVLLLSLSGLKCYANQTATIYFMNGDGTILLGSVAVAANEWSETNTSGTSFRYTLSGSKTINYTVPLNTVATDSSNVRNYSVKVVLANGSSKLSTDSGQSNGNLNTCYHSRFAPSSINFSLSSVTESGWTWSCTDWGSIGTSSNKYSGDYSSVTAQFKTSNKADSGYSNLGSLKTLTPSNGSGTISLSLSSITYDVIYCAVTITLTLNFLAIDSATPTGTKTYPYTYLNLFTLYRATPNLLYGKNFFALNQNSPIPGRTKLLLEISTALYTSGNSVITRDTIYFGTDGSNFLITTNGLVIDCGSW